MVGTQLFLGEKEKELPVYSMFPQIVGIILRMFTTLPLHCLSALLFQRSGLYYPKIVRGFLSRELYVPGLMQLQFLLQLL